MDDALKNPRMPLREAEPATIPAEAKPTKSALPPYLHNNSWEEELNFKLWVTSSARFRADKRCCLRARWSQLSVTLLTSYLIIIGILPLALAWRALELPSED